MVIYSQKVTREMSIKLFFKTTRIPARKNEVFDHYPPDYVCVTTIYDNILFFNIGRVGAGWRYLISN